MTRNLAEAVPFGPCSQQADTHNKGYLEYTDFQQFVKIVKRRPEIEIIYNKLCGSENGTFDLAVFQRFMREYQKVC